MLLLIIWRYKIWTNFIFYGLTAIFVALLLHGSTANAEIVIKGDNYDGNEQNYQRINSVHSPSRNLDMYFPSKINWWSKNGKKYGNINMMPILHLPLTSVDLANFEVANMEALLRQQQQQQLQMQQKRQQEQQLQPEPLSYEVVELPEATQPREPTAKQADTGEMESEGMGHAIITMERANERPSYEGRDSLVPPLKADKVQRIEIFDLGPTCPKGFAIIGGICRRKPQGM